MQLAAENGAREIDLFVAASVAADGGSIVRAFENHCPHAGGPLNLLPDVFFLPDKQHLICTRHGARFLADSGLCVHGPCAGQSLNALPIEVGSEGVMVAETALEDLCRTGSGRSQAIQRFATSQRTRRQQGPRRPAPSE